VEEEKGAEVGEEVGDEKEEEVEVEVESRTRIRPGIEGIVMEPETTDPSLTVKKLSKTLSRFFFTIYPDTNTAIHRAKLAFKHYSIQTPINITFFDFEDLYPNILVK
jgi:hypothetical protein